MKKYLSAIFCLSILVSSNCLFAQAPTISYSSPQSYVVNKAITPLVPVTTGGSVGLPGTYNNAALLVSIPTGQGANFVTVDANNNVFYSVGGWDK
ncbi:hypothetical protein [uncultured Mucilaginibacter sp.]|uniref:hypothetical protein n=1 Tax=uncultured Mucilaginibacter sp. TaxID=797541 RepID=UPI0025F851F0|nr:hypothetical protein [uncultured Mucilaginibacter sp.]